MNENEKPLNINSAAEYLGLKVSSVYNLVFYGKLKAYKPNGKRIYFKLADLENYVFSKSVGGRADRANEILNGKGKTA